jgi:hypothetical protein
LATTSLEPISYAPLGAKLNDIEVNTVLKSSLDLEVKSYANQRQRHHGQLLDGTRATMPAGLFYHFHGEYIQHRNFLVYCMHSLLRSTLSKAANTTYPMN